MTITDNLPIHPGSVPPSPMPDASSSGSFGGIPNGSSSANGGDIKRIHSGEFSHTEKALEAMHDRSVSFDDASLQLPLASSSRTPSRTKRRSVSSTMSLERRASTSGTTYHPIDYASMLKAERKAHFTTSSEKRLLEKLAAAYVDTGQLMHSVETDACDVSSATWWFLRARQKDEEEDRPPSRRETRRKNGNGIGNGTEHGDREAKAGKEDDREALSGADEGVWVKEKEKLERPRSRERDDLLNPKSAGAEIENSRGPSPTDTRATTPRAKPSTSTLTIPAPPATRDAPSTPTREPAGERISPEQSPRDKHTLKTRSPSMSMLQRATSALLGKSGDDDPSHSPTKLQKAPPLPTVDLNERDIEQARPATALGQGQAKSLDLLRDDKDKRDKDRDGRAKRESMWTSWTSFRQFFNDGSIRRKHRDGGTASGGSDKPTMVLSRGIAARAPHANRIAISSAAASTRRASVERPGYSRRSSSVNSRRSSISIIEPARLHSHQVSSIDSTASGVGLYRRSSHRSHGSQTPTSDREFEYPSRPDSATSVRRRDSQRTGIPVLRSPSIQSDTSMTTPRATRNGVPLSPLHNYQRRPPQGTASTRIRHIRVIPESQLLRSNSVASSIQSNPSSRASSIHEDDESVHSIPNTHHYSSSHGHGHGHSRRRKDSESLARQIHRRGSPLVQQQYGSDDSGSRRSSLGGNPHSYRTKPRKQKMQLRDVFQKDDEWVDEEEHRFVGGLGQSSYTVRGNGSPAGVGAGGGRGGGSMASSAWIDGQRTSLASLPSGHSASSTYASGGTGSKRGKFSGMSGGLNLGASVKKVPAAIVEEIVEEEQGHGSTSGQGQGQGGQGQGQGLGRLVQPQPVQAQRRGVPPGRAQPAIIQEEEEEEE